MSKMLYIGLGGLGKSTVSKYLLETKQNEKGCGFAVLDYLCEGLDKAITCIEVGKIDRRYEYRNIRQILRTYDRCIIVCGLGGKCTSEYMPLVIKSAYEAKCTPEVFAATPFRFEGNDRCRRTIEILRQLKSNRVFYRLLSNQSLLSHPLIERNGLKEIFPIWIEFLREKV